MKWVDPVFTCHLKARLYCLIVEFIRLIRVWLLCLTSMRLTLPPLTYFSLHIRLHEVLTARDQLVQGRICSCFRIRKHSAQKSDIQVMKMEQQRVQHALQN